MTPRPRSFLSAANRRARRGFSLLEILIALAIVGLIVGLTVTQFTGTLDGARVDTARMFVNQSLKVPLQSYNLHMGAFPSSADGLQVLLNPPGNRAERWRGPYVQESGIPLDPWGNAYQYVYPGKHNKYSYDLWSKGPDGQDGSADDVTNWAAAQPTGAQ